MENIFQKEHQRMMSSTCYIDWSIEHHLTSHDFIIKSYSSCSFRLAYLGNLGESSLRYFPSIVWLNAILLCWKWLSLDISLCSRNKGNPSWAALILDYIASRTDKRCLRRCCSTFCVWFHAERAEQWWTMGETAEWVDEVTTSWTHRIRNFSIFSRKTSPFTRWNI